MGYFNLSYIIDVVIAAILVVSVIRGFKRGFIKTVFSCFAVVVALGLAYFFGPAVGNLIRTTDVYAGVEEKIDSQIEQYFESKTGDSIQNPLESDNIETLERLGINIEELYGNYEDAMTQGSHNLQEGFTENVAEPILRALSTALGAIAVFIVALIALKLISLLLGGIFSLPVLKEINHVAGLVAGAVFGVLTVFALCLVVEVILPYLPENPILYMGMDKETILYGFFVKISPMFFLLFG